MNHTFNNFLISLNNVGNVFCSYAASVLVQSALLVAVLFVIDLVLRRRVRAIFRYCLWLLVLVKLILPPTLSLPTGIGYWAPEQLPVVTSERFDEVRLEAMGSPAEMPVIRLSERLSDRMPLPATTDASRIPLTSQAILFLLWLLGVLAFSAVLVHKLRFINRLITRSSPGPKSLLEILEHCRSRMGVRRHVQLRLSETISSPAVCGLLRPTVLIPADLLEKLSPEGLRATLIHELAHIKRGDLWINSFQTALQVIYFYNPFVWFANSAIRKVCEEAVDETVLVALEGRAKDYSNTLIDIGEMVFRGRGLRLHLMSVVESKKALQWRIRHMLARPIPTSARLGVVGIATLLVAAAVLLPMAKAEKSGGQSESAYPLHKAATEGDIEQIESLISKGVDVNVKNEDGSTPLHTAAYFGQKEAAQILITKGANVGAKNASGQTPLHIAAAFGGKRVPELLLANGAQINARDNSGDTPLHVAAGLRHDRSALLQLLLEKGADINARNDKGQTPLHSAAIGRRNTRPAAAFLLANGAKINAKDSRGCTALYLAAGRSTKEEVIELLLAKGATINERTDEEMTALHHAALNGQREVVQLLLNQGADIDITDSRGRTALHHAAEADRSGIAELLISKGANVNAKSEDGETPLDMAARRGAVKICALMVAKGAQVDSLDSAIAMGDLAKVKNSIKENTDVDVKNLALCVAVACGREDIVRFLLTGGAQVSSTSKDGQTPLHRAARRGYENLARLLLDRGADVNAKDMRGTPLHYAAARGHEDVVALLIAKGADVNAENTRRCRPFDAAAANYHTRIVQLLLDAGANLEVEGRYDWTPLIGAAWTGRKDLAELLVQRGADVNQMKPGDWSPALSAAHRGYIDILQLLLAHGADVNEKDDSGWSLLHYATGKPDITKLLLEKGADPNVVDRENGCTPLHYVASGSEEGKDYKTVAELLISHGTNVNAKNWEGKTPLTLAQEAGNTDIVKLLKKHGAKE